MTDFYSYNGEDTITAKQFWGIYLGMPIVMVLGIVAAGQLYYRRKDR